MHVIYGLLVVAFVVPLTVATECISPSGITYNCTRYIAPGNVNNNNIWPCGETEDNPCWGLDPESSLFNLSSSDVLCFQSGNYHVNTSVIKSSIHIPSGITLCSEEGTLIRPAVANEKMTFSLFTVRHSTVSPSTTTTVIRLAFTDFSFQAGSHLFYIPATATEKDHELKIEGTAITRVTTRGLSSGAIRSETGTVNIRMCTMTQNVAIIDHVINITTTEEDFYVGGAVVSVGEGTIIANESVFLFNKVEGGNGGVFLSNKRVELHGCHFIHNSALIGGVVYAAQLEVYNSTFETNEATAGGAIQITGGNSIIAGSKFMHNSAMLGAAVSVNNHSGSNSTGPTLTLLHSHFEEHAGVAVYVEAKHLVVDHCVFKYNRVHLRGGKADHGAALALFIRGTVNLTHSEFIPSGAAPKDLQVSLIFDSSDAEYANIEYCKFHVSPNLTLNALFEPASIELQANYRLNADMKTYFRPTYARHNWFGSADGPRACCNLNAHGSPISIGIDFSNWCLDENCTSFSDVSVAETCAILKCGYAPWPVYATVLGVVGLVALIIWAKWGACCSRKRPEPVAAERLTSVSNYERLLSTKYLSRNDSYALEVLSEHASSFERYHVTYKLLSITTLMISVAGGVLVGIVKGLYPCNDVVCPEGQALNWMIVMFVISFGIHFASFIISSLYVSFRPTTRALQLAMALGVPQVLINVIIEPTLLGSILYWDWKRGFDDKVHLPPTNFIICCALQIPFAILQTVALWIVWKMYALIATPEPLQIEAHLATTKLLNPSRSKLKRDSKLDKSSRPLRLLIVFTMIAALGLTIFAILSTFTSAEMRNLLIHDANLSLYVTAILPFIFGVLAIATAAVTLYSVSYYYRTAMLFAILILNIVVAVLSVLVAIIHGFFLSGHPVSIFFLDYNLLLKAGAVALWSLWQLSALVTVVGLYSFRKQVLAELPTAITNNISRTLDALYLDDDFYAE